MEKTTTNEESTVEQPIGNAIGAKENGKDDSVKTEEEAMVNENVFLAFARVYSGRLKQGQKIYVLSPRHDPASFIGKVR